jgi:deazaflavin-dependent oxidoreductase (nitroreductase family)
MPIPARVAQWNKVGLNRVVRQVTPWMPGLALVVHRGRRSGRLYQTPVTPFPTEGGFIIALTYGAEHTDWVRNVQAAGGCELRTRGRVLQLDSPRVYHDETRRGIRAPHRHGLRLIGVADFLSLTLVGDKKRAAHRALKDRILNGGGTASRDLRIRAFDNVDLAPPLRALVGKVASSPTTVTEADFAAAKAAGFSEDQLFELVVCAAVGQSTRLYEAGLAALAQAAGSREEG